MKIFKLNIGSETRSVETSFLSPLTNLNVSKDEGQNGSSKESDSHGRGIGSLLSYFRSHLNKYKYHLSQTFVSR
jgi:hypothetical protein